jgi:hypothetical protein
MAKTRPQLDRRVVIAAALYTGVGYTLAADIIAASYSPIHGGCYAKTIRPAVTPRLGDWLRGTREVALRRLLVRIAPIPNHGMTAVREALRLLRCSVCVVVL